MLIQVLKALVFWCPINIDQPLQFGSWILGRLCKEEVGVDLIPSHMRVTAIVVVVIVLVAVVAWEYARRRAVSLRKKLGSR